MEVCRCNLHNCGWWWAANSIRILGGVRKPEIPFNARGVIPKQRIYQSRGMRNCC